MAIFSSSICLLCLFRLRHGFGHPVAGNAGPDPLGFRRMKPDLQVAWQVHLLAGVPGAVTFPVHTVTTTPTLLDELLASFANTFAEPHGLPPHRSQDHGITLVLGAQPVAVRPYRYPARHKDELERQCSVMLVQGLIRPSLSAFSSSGSMMDRGSSVSTIAPSTPSPSRTLFQFRSSMSCT
jgi:hypothetical protein